MALVGHIACCPPCRQFPVAVKYMTEELEALQEASLGHQSAIGGLYVKSLGIGSIGEEIVKVAYTFILLV